METSNYIIDTLKAFVRATLHPKLYCAKGDNLENKSIQIPITTTTACVVASSGRCSCCTMGLTQ